MSKLKTIHNVFIGNQGPYTVEATGADDAITKAKALAKKSPVQTPVDPQGKTVTDDQALPDTDGEESS